MEPGSEDELDELAPSELRSFPTLRLGTPQGGCWCMLKLWGIFDRFEN